MNTFISFCCLIAEATTSSTMLNSNGGSGHLCLVPDHRRKALNFSPLRVILAVGLSYMTFMMLRYVASIPTVLKVFFFNQKWMLYFVKCFFCIYWQYHMVLTLSFINVVIKVIDLWILDYFCSPGINFTWFWWLILLMYCWIWFASILLRIFSSMLWRLWLALESR